MDDNGIYGITNEDYHGILIVYLGGGTPPIVISSDTEKMVLSQEAVWGLWIQGCAN